MTHCTLMILTKQCKDSCSLLPHIRYSLKPGNKENRNRPSRDHKDDMIQAHTKRTDETPHFNVRWRSPEVQIGKTIVVEHKFQRNSVYVVEQTRKLWYQRRYSSVDRYICLRPRDQDNSWRMSQTISGTTELYAVTFICTQTLWTCETCTVMMQQSSLQILNSMGNITKTSGTNTSYSGNQLFIHSETSHVNDCTPRVWTHDAVDPTDVWQPR